jgi:PBP1b-binding outer membrane lipoprotein LpoB
MNMKKLQLIILLMLALSACTNENSTQKETPNTRTLPTSQGQSGEVILVMDSAKWKGKLGDLVREVVNPPYAGLLNDEPTFTLRYINPLKMGGLLNRAHTIIFVTSLEGESAGTRRLMTYMTEEQINEIKSNDKKFFQVNQSVFAQPQRVFQIYGKDDETLAENLKKHKESIFRLLYDHILERMSAKIYQSGEQTKFAENLHKNHGYKIRIPYGYALAKDDMKDETGFTFIRKIEGLYDHNLFIAYKPYKDTADLSPKNIQAWRDSICKTYIFDSEMPESYVVTETLEPPRFRKIELNKHYTIEMRGLWRTSVKSMGGPFVSHTIVDTKKELLYYVEGFIYAPGKDKREFMREIEAFMRTFSPN